MQSIVDRVMRGALRTPWSGTVYRTHGPTWKPDDPGGSLSGSGRWNVGENDPDERMPFPALYTATSPAVATWEYIRHSKRPDGAEMWQRLRVTLATMTVALPSAMDLRDPGRVGLAVGTLTGDDYELPRAIASAAYARGASGLLVPTATGVGAASGDYNVVVFFELTGNVTTVYGFPTAETTPRTGVAIEILGSEAPNLPP